MPTPLSLYVGNSNILELTLTDGLTEAAITSGTVVATLLDKDGVEVSGDTWPKTLSHAGSGVYRATIDESIAIMAGRRYTARITATYSGLTYLDNVNCFARTRER